MPPDVEIASSMENEECIEIGIFLINGSKYYELNNYENMFYFSNILNIVISYSIVINFIISIFTNYKR